MVRIQRRVSKKRYLNSKRVYTYERMSLHIPKEHHETVRPFLKQDLDLSIKPEKGSLVVTLTHRGNVSACRKHPDKTRSKTTKAQVQQRQTPDSA